VLSPPTTRADPPADPLRDRPHAGEERFNAATHAVGLALAIVGASVVVGRASGKGTPWQLAACVAYAVTLVAAYAASTLSHVFRDGRLRRGFRIADQAVIFLFIAGSYAPLAAAWLRGGHWWVLHSVIFGVALLGFVSKAAFAHRVEVGTVSAALYLLLGWSPLFAARPIVAAMPEALSFCLLLGGLCYTVGLLFFSFDHRVRYFHAAWHVMVMAGSACHYYGILQYCTGR
jgi:hemolysin III